MDQKEDAGHHAITREATDRLFANREKIDGKDEATYTKELDEAQEYADRHPGNSPLDWGDTWKPYWMAPDAQREHSMADPAKSAEENLQAISGFVTGQLDNAHAAHTATRDFDALDRDHDSHLSSAEIEAGMGNEKLRSSAQFLQKQMGELEELSNDELGDENDGVTRKDLDKAEMRSLGAATHALEDSYSNAHMFRDTSDPSNPHAAVEGINVFNPADDEGLAAAGAGAVIGGIVAGPGGALLGGILGGVAGYVFGNDQETHDKRFDSVPTADGRPTDPVHLAGAQATAEMLDNYYEHRDEDDQSAHQAFAENVESYYQASPGGVRVYDDNDNPAWQREVEERLNPPVQVGQSDEAGGAAQDDSGFYTPQSEVDHHYSAEDTGPIYGVQDSSYYNGADTDGGYSAEGDGGYSHGGDIPSYGVDEHESGNAVSYSAPEDEGSYWVSDEE